MDVPNMGRLALMENLSIESFQPLVGGAFQLQTESSNLGLVLAECSPLKVSGPNVKRKPFRLIFNGALQPILPQRIYRLANAELGTLDMFIVPIGPQGDHMQYEAVFT